MRYCKQVEDVINQLVAAKVKMLTPIEMSTGWNVNKAIPNEFTVLVTMNATKTSRIN